MAVGVLAVEEMTPHRRRQVHQMMIIKKNIGIIGTLTYLLGYVIWIELWYKFANDEINNNIYHNINYIFNLARYIGFILIFYQLYLFEQRENEKKLIYIPAIFHQMILLFVYGCNLLLEFSDQKLGTLFLFDNLLRGIWPIRIINFGILICFIFYLIRHRK